MSSYISAIGTAVPKNKLSQRDTMEFMLRHLPLSNRDKRQVQLLYRASGIHYRHSVIDDFGRHMGEFSFFPKSDHLEPFPTISRRMQLYREKALDLATEAVRDALKDERLSQISHLITVSCTGMYAPGLDIELVEHLGLPSSTRRTAINFMGCYAAFNALKVAYSITKAEPASKVLIVAVELCSIHLLKNTSEDSLLSNTLFGDGAAAVLVEGLPQKQLQLELTAFYSDLAPEGKKAMAWNISDFGFEMTLSAEVPDIIRHGIAQLTQNLLNQLQMLSADVDYYAIHPGGKRILEVIEEELSISPEQNHAAYDVLRNHGNMSSPTVLFVIKQLLDGFTEKDKGKNLLSFAFGPGLTMESMLTRIA